MQIIVVIREPGGPSPDYSLKFEVPVVPQIGAYLSIHRPDTPEPFGEDMVVRQVWWRLHHPETAGATMAPGKVGSVVEIFVECEPAIGPYSSERWRKSVERHGCPAATLDVVRRIEATEADLRDMK